MNVVLNARLRNELQLGVFGGYLELSCSELMKRNTDLYFRFAKEAFVNESAMNLITNNIDMLRELMSILARIAALASLTNRRSWPILAIAFTIPALDTLFKMIPWRKHKNRSNDSIYIC